MDGEIQLKGPRSHHKDSGLLLRYRRLDLIRCVLVGHDHLPAFFSARLSLSILYIHRHLLISFGRGATGKPARKFSCLTSFRGLPYRNSLQVGSRQKYQENQLRHHQEIQGFVLCKIKRRVYQRQGRLSLQAAFRFITQLD